MEESKEGPEFEPKPAPPRRRLRLSIRFLLVLVLVVGGGLGWFIRRATVQRDAVRAITAAGGTVAYDFQRGARFGQAASQPGPKWLVDRVGIDFFADVVSVRLLQPQPESILEHVGRLSRLEQLHASSINATGAGVANLARLTRLKELYIQLDKVDDAALSSLSRLTGLEHLAFGGDSGDNAGMAHLSALTNLEMLQVHGPWFDDSGLAPVSHMGHLETFFVSDLTSVTADGLGRLHRERPSLRIGINGSGKVPRVKLDLLRSAVGR